MKKARAILPKTSDNQCAATTTLDKETNKAKDNNEKITRALRRNSIFLKAKKTHTKKRLNIVAAWPLGKLLKRKIGSKNVTSVNL